MPGLWNVRDDHPPELSRIPAWPSPEDEVAHADETARDDVADGVGWSGLHADSCTLAREPFLWVTLNPIFLIQLVSAGRCILK